MPTTRDDVRNALSVQDPDALRAILAAAQVGDGGARSSADLADRITRALWWNAQTPLGYALDRTELETIVQRVAKRLGVQDKVGAHGDAWTQLPQLTKKKKQKNWRQ